MAFKALDAVFIGTVLEGLFYGLYCLLFVLYIRVHTSKKAVDRNLLIYPLSTLFVLCTVYFITDFCDQYLMIRRPKSSQALAWRLNVTTSAIYGFIDFIAQGVLIYRCWVVWSHQLIVIAVPSILALTSLATSLTLTAELHLIGNTPPPSWFTPVGVASFSLSLAVNTIFTGLLVFKIVKSSLALRRSLAGAGHRRNDLRSLVSMLIESGVVLFVVQLIWVIAFSLELNAFYLVGGPIAMIYGIIPTLIVVRVGMGQSYDSKTLSVESDIRFGSANDKSHAKISGSPLQWNPHLSQTMLTKDSRETM